LGKTQDSNLRAGPQELPDPKGQINKFYLQGIRKNLGCRGACSQNYPPKKTQNNKPQNFRIGPTLGVKTLLDGQNLTSRGKGATYPDFTWAKAKKRKNKGPALPSLIYWVNPIFKELSIMDLFLKKSGIKGNSKSQWWLA